MTVVKAVDHTYPRLEPGCPYIEYILLSANWGGGLRASVASSQPIHSLSAWVLKKKFIVHPHIKSDVSKIGKTMVFFLNVIIIGLGISPPI